MLWQIITVVAPWKRGQSLCQSWLFLYWQLRKSYCYYAWCLELLSTAWYYKIIGITYLLSLQNCWCEVCVACLHITRTVHHDQQTNWLIIPWLLLPPEYLLWIKGRSFCYATAFRCRRHYVFGLSVRPSVRSLKYPLLTCTWVRWSTRPTVIVLQHVRPSVRPSGRPSVRPERFPGICRRMHGWIGLKFYMLMYLDHRQN